MKDKKLSIKAKQERLESAEAQEILESSTRGDRTQKVMGRPKKAPKVKKTFHLTQESTVLISKYITKKLELGEKVEQGETVDIALKLLAEKESL